MADNNNVFTAVDQAGYDYYGNGTDYSDCWTYPKEKIDELVGDSLTGIETAKEEAIAAVQEAGSDAVQEIEEKGEETLESIPDDYTQLSNDVSELKTDFTHLENDKADIIVNSASGAIASLNDGANYPVKQTVFEMNPVQDLHGQEYPYPAGGGKNLADFDKTFPITNENMLITDFGADRTFSACTITVFCTSVVYTFPGNTLVRLRDSNNNDVNITDNEFGMSANTTLNGAYSVTKTNVTFQKVYLMYYSGFTSGNMKIQIESGSTATSFAPYSNICPILGHTEVDAVRTGVNVLQLPMYYASNTNLPGLFFIKAGTYYLNFDIDATNWRVGIWMRDKNGNNLSDLEHCPSSLFSWYANPGCWLFGANATHKSFPITIAEDCYIRICYRLGDTSASTTCSNQMLNLGSTASAYEPYSGQSVTYTLGQTVYAGTLTVNEDGSGQIVSTMASVDLGTLNWNNSSQFKMFFSTGIKDLVKKPSSTAEVANILSSKFRPISYDGLNLLTKGRICISAVGSIGIVDGNTYADVASFKTAMSGVQLVYELAEPVIINLTEQEALETLYGNNNVWHDANGDTEVTYRADTKKYIDNKFAELQTLIANL